MTTARMNLGRRGEDLAVRWYRAHGYTVVDRNWRCRHGELDLVAVTGEMVVFCEVKTRSSDRFGTPAEAVTTTKQRRIRSLAMQWLDATGTRRRTIRFDVASVMLGSSGYGIEVLTGAF